MIKLNKYNVFVKNIEIVDLVNNVNVFFGFVNL